MTLEAAKHCYVHVPFCARRCSYCDFAIAVRREVPVSRFSGGIMREIEIRRLVDGPPLDTLYFGGGTPSRLGGEGLAALVRNVRAMLPLAPDAEVTIEANPEDVSPDDARAWAEAGVNRVSLGVQSFSDPVLRWMHRSHGPDAPARAVEALCLAGINNVSVDLIYALPEALPRDWDDDLSRALALGPQHLSCYGLTVEPATPLGRWVERGEASPSGEDRYERDFLATHTRLTGAGLAHYEVSNYAITGKESRHNRSYWLGVPYIGLGPSAHGFHGDTRRWNQREYVAWLRDVERGEDPIGGSENLTPPQRAIEQVYLGLRTTSGLSLRAGELSVVQAWLDAGWGEVQNDTLRLTPLGWLRLDALVAALTDHRSRY